MQTWTAQSITLPVRLAHEVSADNSTEKVLLQMKDGTQIETVLLKYRERYTVCVSTQVGCACRCDFCATGQMGFVRQLSAGEIVGQVQHFQHTLAQHRQSVSNVVFMGMGEPLLNETETMQAIDMLIAPQGLGFAPRRVTLSTVGIVPGILRLAERHSRMPIKLAISLHAATNALRTSLMPINATYPLASLFDAARHYTESTRRRIFFEWVMIGGINDSLEQAQALVAWLQDLPAHVNLIQLNPTNDGRYLPAAPEAVEAFAAALDQHGIPHTMRQRRGGGIHAGCGQLSTMRGEA
jgi:23S rRNA (adenine2503-C2)-methyltransferase